MESVNITSAQYNDDGFGNNSMIIVIIDGVEMNVPIDPNNRHYAEIMRRVDEGTLTIADAE